ncbi:MAG: carbon-nitrogen hydrolase family protein [Clostridiaceae bacterium]|nr:carbon-nitrogen hydrolase family protein [Clostridiaceae bacterium]
MKSKVRLCAVAAPAYEKISLIPEVDTVGMLNLVEEACTTKPDLILLPQYSADNMDTVLKLRELARQNKVYIVYNMQKTKDSETWNETIVIDRQGEEVFSYVKTHCIDGYDPDIKPGDRIEVAELDFAKVALAAGSDIYFPELFEIYSVKGAEILLYCAAVEPLRDDTQVTSLIKARSVEDYMFTVSATYASTVKKYMTNCYEHFSKTDKNTEDVDLTLNTYGVGRHTGNAAVYGLRGEIIASTGREKGYVTAVVDLDKKRNIKEYINGPCSIVRHQNERGVFDEIVKDFEYKKEPGKLDNPRISIVHLSHGNTILRVLENPPGELDLESYKPVFEKVERAAKNTDFVVLSELAVWGHKISGQIMDRFSQIARDNNCYIIHNATTDGNKCISFVLNRQGECIFEYEKVNMLNFMYEHTMPAGDKIEVFDTEYGKMGIMVCADLRCQEIPRILGLKGARVVFAQNQAWGFDSVAINDIHFKAFAIENCYYLVHSNFATSQVSHRSMVIDPAGYIICATDYDTEQILRCELDLSLVENKKHYIFEKGGVVRAEDFKKRLFDGRRPKLYTMLTSG